MTITKKDIQSWTEQIIHYSAYVYLTKEHGKDKVELYKRIFMKRADARCGRRWSVVAEYRDSGADQ